MKTKNLQASKAYLAVLVSLVFSCKSDVEVGATFKDVDCEAVKSRKASERIKDREQSYCQGIVVEKIESIKSTLNSISLAGSASDAYVNSIESNDSSLTLASPLTESGFEEATYALAAAATDCSDTSLTYGNMPVTNAVAALAEGSYKICGKIAPKDNDPVYGSSKNFTWDKTKPADAVLTGLPTASSTVLDVTVSGTDVATYHYALLTDGSACADATFSDWIVVATKISDALTGVGAKKLCVRGKDIAGNISENITENSWTQTSTDTPNPVPGGTSGSTLSASSVSYTSLDLSWNLATDDTTTSANLQYKVYYATSSMGTTLAGVEAGTGVGDYASQISTKSITNLAIGTAYFFNVVVKDKDGNKAIYTELSQSTLTDTTAPTAGGGTTTITASRVGTQIDLSWSASSDNANSASSLTYRVYYSTSSMGSTVSGVEAGTASGAAVAAMTSKSITGLTAFTKYYFNVVVSDTSGNKAIYAETFKTIASCPTGYVLVARDSDNEVADFCVMKYEAKCSLTDGSTCSGGSETAASTTAGTPWTKLEMGDATKECEALGSGYHLITNAEWMAAASDAANVASNWNNNAVGSAYLASGHSDGDPNSPCDGAKPMVAGDCSNSGNESLFSQRRTINLSNGEVIWDMPGNVHEVIDYFNKDDKPTPLNASYEAYTAVGGTKTMPKTFLTPENVKSYWTSTWANTERIGGYYPAANATGGMLQRGGYYGTASSGLFSVLLENSPTTATFADSGFRCAISIDGTLATLEALNPQATAGKASVTLSWGSPGGSITGYRISYAQGDTAPATCAAGTTIAETAIKGTKHTIEGLTQAGEYSFRICTINNKDTQDVSTGVTVTSITTASCPTGYVSVPGDANYATDNFCVMKYEAKDESSAAASAAANTPWVSISQETAKMECASLGEGFHLISNGEWMTIAANMGNVTSNWDGGVVGTNSLSRGHSDNTPANSIAASTDDTAGCINTGQTCDNTTFHDQRRTHSLSNGQVTWDFAGNVWEWTSYFNNSDKPSAGSSWTEYSATPTSTSMPTAHLVPTNAVKTYWNNSWNSTQNIGQIDPAANNAGGALHRGGHFADTNKAGIFAADLSELPTEATLTTVGFRCARVLFD